MIFVERGEIMTKYDDMTPAARFFHDLAGEGYPHLRKAVIEAYKDAVRTGKPSEGYFRSVGDANERSPMRVFLAEVLEMTDLVGGQPRPLWTDELIARLPFFDGDDFNWDGFDDWLDLDGGWATFRDICLDWEPRWFTDFLEREGYIDKGV